MRRIIFLLLLSLTVMSCSMIGMQPVGILYTGVTTPYLMKAEHQGSYEYQILGEANGQSSAISILSLVAFGDAGYNQAYQDALQQYPQADVLIDVSSDYQATSVLGLFTKATTQIHGKAAKLILRIPSSSLTASVPSSEKSTGKSQFVPQKESLFQRELKMGSHGVGASYINGSGKYDESGFSLDYNFSRILNEKFNYYVNFSFITMSNTITKKRYSWGDNYYQDKISYSTLFLPLYFGLKANATGFPQVRSLIQKVPVKGIAPYANVGAGWYIIRKASESEYSSENSSWSFAVIGVHLGMGSSFSLNKNFTLHAGFNYHLLLNADDVNFWQWRLGLTF